jgi:hypothetical protein
MTNPARVPKNPSVSLPPAKLVLEIGIVGVVLIPKSRPKVLYNLAENTPPIPGWY